MSKLARVFQEDLILLITFVFIFRRDGVELSGSWVEKDIKGVVMR